MQTLSLYLLSMDRTKERLYISIAASAIMVAGCFLLVPFFGGEGAAFARIVVFLAMCVMMIVLLRFGSEFNKLYFSLAKVAFASFTCALAAWLSLEVLNGGLGLVVAIAVGAVVYVVALRIFKAVEVEDALVLVGGLNRLPNPIARWAQILLGFVAPGAMAAGIKED